MSKFYEITPNVRNEVRFVTSDGTKYPLGVAFEFKGSIEALREEMPDYEISVAKKPEEPGVVLAPETDSGYSPKEGEQQ